MSKHIIRTLSAALILLFFVSLNGCSPALPEHLWPTKKMPITPPPPPPPPPIKAAARPKPLPEPLADPEIAAAPKLLRVGIFQDTPPYIYHKDTKIEGLEADLARQLGTFSGKNVRFIKVPERRAAEALLQGHIDIVMSGRKIFRSEDQSITFSEPYLRAGQILLVRSRDRGLFSTGIYSLENSGVSLGVIEGSGGDLFLTKTIQGVRIIRFKKVQSAIQALRSKKIDLFLHDAPTICHYAAINKSAGITPILTLVTEEYLGWTMRKEDEKLRQQANHFIRQSKDDGQLQKTIKHWIPNL